MCITVVSTSEDCFLPSVNFVQDGVTGPLRAERDALKERLDEVSSSLRDATARLENVSDERDQLKFQLTRLDEKLSKKESCVACV